ncbi:MAG: hypothetical protein RLZZ283_779 [Candidatus Parcubacteria bacterium]|jgi:hypothetical protein
MNERVTKRKFKPGAPYSMEDALEARTWMRNLLGLPYIDPSTPLTRQDQRTGVEAQRRGLNLAKKLNQDPALKKRSLEARIAGTKARKEKLRAEIPKEYQKLFRKTSLEVGAQEARKQIVALVAKDRAKAEHTSNP